jgi:Antitoxin ParD
MPRLDIEVTDKQQSAVKLAAAIRGQSVSEYVRRKVVVGSEASPYPFAGPTHGPSLIRDLSFTTGFSEGDSSTVDEAYDRLHKFERWSQDNPIMFAPQTTTTASQIFPTGYATPITIPMTADRPLSNATDVHPINSSNPFNVPRHTSGGTVHAARTEGSQPTEVDLVFGTVSVVPRGLAGKIDLTRELVDSASPGGDIIALQIMREDWYAQAEALIYTELNGANGQGGTITAGFVPSGAQARVDAAPTTGLLVTLKKALLEYANVRRKKARNVVAGATALTNLGGLVGAEANTGDDASLFSVFGARVNAAVNTFGTASTDCRIAILGSNDVTTFESPLAEFRFDEQAGPAIVRCSVWGYFAVSVTRPIGLSSIRFT